MDPAPRAFADLPRDSDHGLPVPFACGTDDARGALSAGVLDQRRVIQCALSRVCSVCGAGLGRPLVLLGSAEEADRLAFHFPPAHPACVDALVQVYSGAGERIPGGVLGQDDPVASWVTVTTGGFEFVRPGRDETDRRPIFCPNSVIERIAGTEMA